MQRTNTVLLIGGLLGALVCGRAMAATDISGIWQHAAKPVQLAVDIDAGVMRVQHHSNNPGANDLTVIRAIQPLENSDQRWTGEMYNGYLDTYVAVTLRLTDESSLTVLDEDKVAVLRLNRLQAEQK